MLVTKGKGDLGITKREIEVNYRSWTGHFNKALGEVKKLEETYYWTWKLHSSECYSEKEMWRTDRTVQILECVAILMCSVKRSSSNIVQRGVGGEKIASIMRKEMEDYIWKNNIDF